MAVNALVGVGGAVVAGAGRAEVLGMGTCVILEGSKEAQGAAGLHSQAEAVVVRGQIKVSTVRQAEAMSSQGRIKASTVYQLSQQLLDQLMLSGMTFDPLSLLISHCVSML